MTGLDSNFSVLKTEIQHEFHARPALSVDVAQSLIYHWSVVTQSGAAGLGAQAPLTPEAAYVKQHYPFDGRHSKFELANGTLRVERHTEFLSFTFVPTDPQGEEGSLLAGVSPLLGTHVFCASRIKLVNEPRGAGDDATGTQRLYGGRNTGIGYEIETSFVNDARGFVEYQVWGAQSEPIIRGRIIKLLTDIEMYRLAAMMALPLTQQRGATLRSLESQVQQIGRALDEEGEETNAENVHRISELLLSVQELQEATQYRFAASSAYRDIVEARLDAIDEVPVAMRTTLRDFIDHRLTPAMKSVQAFDNRLKLLADASQKLMSLARTKFDLEIQTQNQMLLELMVDRARQQIRLTHAIEGFSVVAITYYAMNLIKFALGAVPPLPLADEVVLGGLIPVVAVATFGLTRFIQRRVSRD